MDDKINIAQMFTGKQIVDALRTTCFRSKALIEAGKESEGAPIANAIMDDPTGAALAEAIGGQRMSGIVMGMVVAIELLSNTGTVN